MKAAIADLSTEAARLVQDLHRPKAAIYWVDLLASAAIGWGAFAAAFAVPQPLSTGLIVIAVLALYRGLCFIHEISHHSGRTLPGFEIVWNLLVGFPLLLPSLMYAGVHREHHRLATYGTESDPEYMPFARSARMTAAFTVQSLALPGVLALRYLLLAPVAFLAPPLERWLIAHASSLCLNLRYLRPVTPETLRMARGQTAGILVLWAGLVSLAVAGYLPVGFFYLWYIVLALISLINTLRTLAAHAYKSDGNPLSREEQLEDSIDTPGFRWGVLWAPVGLRFHGLHHYFPGIPYHNLGEAYRRLTAGLPAEAPIHRIRSKSLWHSLRLLYRNGCRRRW